MPEALSMFPRVLTLLALLVLVVLAAPPIKLNPGRLVVPLGESRSAAWQGPGKPQLEVTNAEVAEARLEGGKVVVRGLVEGDTEICLTFGDKQLFLPVQVRVPAARLPARLSVSLTGSEVSHNVLVQAIRAALDAQSGLDPRAQLSINPRRQGDNLLVDASASGAGLLPVSRTAETGQFKMPHCTPG